MKTELRQILSGYEVYYTNSLMLLVKNMLRSKFHCQKDFNSFFVSYEIVLEA